MKLLDNDSIIISLEKAAEISLGIMGIMGLESDHAYYKGAKATYESIIEAFKRQEEFVDAVPVVRCKDCKYWYDGMWGRYCTLDQKEHSESYYCADGEREDGDADERSGKV